VGSPVMNGEGCGDAFWPRYRRFGWRGGYRCSRATGNIGFHGPQATTALFTKPGPHRVGCDGSDGFTFWTREGTSL
jgi:hypothetical protein